jgi:hypothetical protein
MTNAELRRRRLMLMREMDKIKRQQHRANIWMGVATGLGFFAFIMMMVF